MTLRSLLLTALLFSSVSQAADPIRVAIDPTFPPMEYIQNNQRTGFDVDLAAALSKQMGRPWVYTDMDFKAMVPSVLAGRQDIVLSAIYITDDRKKVVDFTDPYFSAGLVVMVKKGDTRIKTPQDLAGKRVAVQVGTKSVKVLADQFPSAQSVEVEKNEEMFNSLEAGRADAVVTGKPAALLYSKTRGTTQILPEPLTHEEYGIAVSKREPELRQQLNDALKAIKADGTYDALQKKWFGTAAQ
ncbi:glutamine ABC transporter substrate-binding protein [Pantoea sp. At-9b]|jgi:polar amino acid transport system substrate-binding protein|uniref:glutamine ABC transporter substrate-binding protein n=1 Tax=Pantoea sp. (strain At-9b) TaxID=592316 RepID=UPI0001B3FE1B|nr:glutamine ABC transporter substrate-binding protein [Pantoea sp. At-9b]ADU69257.1 extracellular solute-binding protein family 3 [Pantoea sp. At-9b]